MQEQNTTQAPKLPPRSRLNTPAKTAEIYGVSLRALKRAWADRRLRYYKMGHRSVLLDTRDVEDFLSRCRVDALRV